MDLRSSLQPPRIQTSAILQLATLVEEIDLLTEGEATTRIRTFNRLVGSNLEHEDFREYFAAQSAEEFAFEQLVENTVTPTPDMSRQELVELVRRAMTAETNADTTAYHALLRVNEARKAIGWIYWPPDWNAGSNTWGNGQAIGEYTPSAEQIVDWLSADRASALE